MDAIERVLQFGPAGKLESLCLAGHPNVLHTYPHEFDLGNKLFRPAGWDECFPTIDPYQNSPVMGELIGLTPHTIHNGSYIQQIWHTDRFEAQRIFTLQNETSLTVIFRVTNYQTLPLDFLWASHALFTTRGLLKVQAASGVDMTDFSLDDSQNKFFHPNHNPVELTYPNFRLQLTTDQPWWGVWLNRGGWPVGAQQPFCCLGIEATNTPGECPDGKQLATGETFEGRVTITFV